MRRSSLHRTASPRAGAAVLACALALSVHPGVAGAAAVQEPPRQEVEVITLERALRLAGRVNTQLGRARADVSVRGAVATREAMDFLPDLELSSGATRTFGRSFSQEEGQILSETTDFFGLDLSATLPLFDGFERFSSLQRAGHQQEASRLRLQRTRQDVAFQVIERFTILLQNEGLVEVREEELETQERLLEQVRGLVEVGRRPVSDLYQQQAARAEAEVALLDARRTLELSRTELIQVLQLDPLGEYEFRAPALQDTLALEEEAAEMEAGAPAAAGVRQEADTAADLARLMGTALERRADLRAVRTDVRASEEGVDVARSGYWPSLSLSFGYGSDWSSEARQVIPGTGEEPRLVTVDPVDGEPFSMPVPGSGSDPEFVHPSLLEQLDARRGGSFRISLSVPVFDRLQTRTNVQQAEAGLLNARYDLDDRRQEVALQVRQAVLDHRLARARLRAAAERLRAARQAREAAERRYELGAATFVELAQASSAYVAARSARVTAGYDVRLARKLIDYFTGELDPEDPMSETQAGDSR